MKTWTEDIISLRLRFYSLSLFQKRIRRTVAILSVLLITHLMFTPLEVKALTEQLQLHKQASNQNQSQSQTLSRTFSIMSGERDLIEFVVETPGTIQATAEWTGSASKLALILNGPGMTQYYARQDGSSPLTLSFTATPEILARGTTWKISVANFQPNSNARGSILVSFPGAKPASAQVETKAAGTVQPKAQEQAAESSAQAQNILKVETRTSQQEAQQKPVEAASGQPRKTAGIQVVQGEEQWTAEELQDISRVRTKIEEMIAQNTRSSPIAGIIIPLFFQELENFAANPALIRQYFKSSERKRTQTETDFARYFSKALKAYKDIPADYKARYLHPAYLNLTRSSRPDSQRLGNDIVKIIRPSLELEVRQAVKASFDPKRLAKSLTGLEAVEITSQKTTTPTTRAKIVKTAPVSQVQVRQIENLLKSDYSTLSEGQKEELKAAVTQLGFPMPETSTSNPLYQFLVKEEPLRTKDFRYNPLLNLNNVTNVIDYYRYLITLDWFYCQNKNEYRDEPYFGVFITAPQFDPSNPAFFNLLKDGCLNYVSSDTTSTYGGVKTGTERGLKGRDRIIYDYLTFNSPVSFTIQLWEEDFSKGSVADGIQRAAQTIMLNMQNEIKAAITSMILSAIGKALNELLSEAGGPSLSLATQFVDALTKGDLSFVDFQKMLFNLFSGRAIDPAWYLIYFLLSGGDLMQMVAMVGGGSTVVGWIFLGMAILGPALGDMISSFRQGDTERGLFNLFKIITVVPLIVDFVVKIFTSIYNLFKTLAAIIDPDDFIGARTVVIEKTSSDWQNDAADGEWTRSKLMGAVSVSDAVENFRKKGYGPTAYNSSLVWNNLFWVPGFTIGNVKPVKIPVTWDRLTGRPLTWQTIMAGTEYNIYYEVLREVAGGQTTFGYYLPDNRIACREIEYKSKSSPNAWWQNVIRVSVMSLNTSEWPWVVLVDTKTGQATYAEAGNPVFEIEATPGRTYKLFIWKFWPGEVGGYVSVYEGPNNKIECQKESSPGQRSGSSTPSGSNMKRHLR